MKKYEVTVPTVINYTFTVEAEDMSEAIDIAYDLYAGLTDEELMTNGSEAEDILDCYVEEVE